MEPTFVRRFSSQEHTKNLDHDTWVEEIKSEIRNELENLLNTRQSFYGTGLQAGKSALDYGVKDFSLVDLNSSSMKYDLKKHIEEQILKYIGRIESVQVLLKQQDADEVRQLKIHIEAKVKNFRDEGTFMFVAGSKNSQSGILVQEVE